MVAFLILTTQTNYIRFSKISSRQMTVLKVLKSYGRVKARYYEKNNFEPTSQIQTIDYDTFF
jgi:hypothetical protein